MYISFQIINVANWDWWSPCFSSYLILRKNDNSPVEHGTEDERVYSEHHHSIVFFSLGIIISILSIEK